MGLSAVVVKSWPASASEAEQDRYWADRARRFQEDQARSLAEYHARCRADVEGYVMVYLAPDEWGNEAMERAARAIFDAHPDVRFVQVYEHAGWYLGWRRDGSVWSTANDRGRLAPHDDQCNGVVRWVVRRSS